MDVESVSLNRWLEKYGWTALSLLVAAAYANSLGGAYLFDDIPGILENTSVRSLWRSVTEVYSSRNGITLSGRPFAQFTFALEYALHGLSPQGCRVVNIAIHALTAVLMMAVAKRVFMACGKAGKASALAFLAALLWALHPIQTESVTYVVQRVEALAGLAMMASLYCLCRAAEGGGGFWGACSVGACVMGVLSKESAGLIPPLAFAFDAVYLSCSAKNAWRGRREIYLGLGVTLIPLAALVFFSGGRGGSVGSAVKISSWDYFVTQLQSIVRYLSVALWPSAHSVDFGITPAGPLTNVLPQALLLIVLAAATAYFLRMKPKAGFAGLWFFATLAPSSSFMPINQTMAEHRFYLPLAAISMLVVAGADAACTKARLGKKAFPALLLVAALVLGGLTVKRNLDYRSFEAMMEATVRMDPANVRARINYANILVESLSGSGPKSLKSAGESASLAEENLLEAMRLAPENASAAAAYGNLLEETGRTGEAETYYHRALELQPDNPAALNNLGIIFARRGEFSKAAEFFGKVLAVKPDYPAAAENLRRARTEIERKGSGAPQ